MKAANRRNETKRGDRSVRPDKDVLGSKHGPRMLRHPGAVLSCLADEIEVNIDLLSVVLFLVPPRTFMYLDAFNKLPHQFRRQFRNIGILI